ncbi:helix-turn-helix domain-containing protein [Streptomyces sp. NPDC058373]|uniref:helix-turn-helix domain-containing protein n=1 Tax=Streptomyces sp. NPDC058373 TaxID=3346465 RepID=UPI00365F8F91
MRVPGLPTPNKGSTLGVVTPNGAAIRVIRELRGLSLRRLAHLIGRDPGYLSHVETGRQGAGDETLRRIAGELRIPLDAITREKTSDQHAGGDDGDAPGAR